MTSTSTLVQYFPSEVADASFSKNYLTKHNYRGQHLLRSIGGASSIHIQHLHRNTTTTRQGMATVTDEDIMALPMSSDEEDQSPTTDENQSNTSTSSKRKAEDTQPPQPNKRARGVRKGTRASQRTAQTSEPQPAPQSEITVPEFPEFLSQSSQQRRAKTYGRSNSYTLNSSQNSKLADPGEAPSTPRKSQPGSFNAPDEIQRSRKRRSPEKKIKEVDIPGSATKPKRASIAFQMPDDGLPNSSSISTGISDIFDPGDSPETSKRKRSGSTSSLSSLDSLASHELSQKQKLDLENGGHTNQPVPPGHIRCPLCQEVIDPDKLTLPPALEAHTNPDSLPLRLQQKYCHTHRLHAAHRSWKSHAYPSIDWTRLETTTIPSHMPHLRQILYRKTPSYYLDHLDSTLKSFRANQSKIRKYMAHDIVDFVKTGYYGPKGAKVMGDQITSEMSNHLKRSLKADKTVRAVGVAGYVSAVLIPELLVRLVVDDMGLDGDEEQARKVIGDSTDVGMLLWPDDDHVDADDDEM